MEKKDREKMNMGLALVMTLALMISMMLTAVPEAGRIFDHWEEDGNKDNPRMVSPANGDAFTAIFK